jgi:hypothetical protein
MGAARNPGALLTGFRFVRLMTALKSYALEVRAGEIWVDVE